MTRTFMLPGGEIVPEVEYLRWKVKNQRRHIRDLQASAYRRRESQLTEPLLALRAIAKIGRPAQPHTLAERMAVVAQAGIERAALQSSEWTTDVRGDLVPRRELERVG